MILRGRVLDIENASGTGGDGKPYSNLRAYVLEGKTVTRAKIADGFGPLAIGEVVTAEVRITPWLDRDKAAQVAVSLVKRADLDDPETGEVPGLHAVDAK